MVAMIGKVLASPHIVEKAPERRQRSPLDHVVELRERQTVLREKMREMARQMEQAREAARIQAEQFRLMRIALEIAARIMRGDNVPPCDKDFFVGA